MKKALIQLMGAFVLLLVAAGAYGVWYGVIRSASAEAAGLSAEVKQKSETSTRVSAAKAQLAELAPQETAINQYFISTNDVVPFLEQLSQTGKFLGATVDVASVSATPGTPYGSLNLSLKISGSFEAVMRTLGSIEYGPYDIRTTSVTLDNGAGQNGTAASATWVATGAFVISTQAPSTATAHFTAPASNTSTSSAPNIPTPSTSTSSVTHTASSSTRSGVATPGI